MEKSRVAKNLTQVKLKIINFVKFPMLFFKPVQKYVIRVHKK